jgi:hypothetical protein
MRCTRGLWSVAALVLFLGVALGALAARPARAGALVVLPRPGQVGVSASGLYGTLLDAGNVGDQFGSGAGMAVRLRYRMRYERGFGLSFENHGFDPRSADSLRDLFDGATYPADSSVAYKNCNLFLYGVDFYQLFGTRTKTTKMLSAGVGLAHPVFTLNSGEQQFPLTDGAYLSVGAGVERFFWQSLAFELGARYHAVFLGGKTNHDLQVSAGLVFYASL